MTAARLRIKQRIDVGQESGARSGGVCASRRLFDAVQRLGLGDHRHAYVADRDRPQPLRFETSGCERFMMYEQVSVSSVTRGISPRVPARADPRRSSS